MNSFEKWITGGANEHWWWRLRIRLMRFNLMHQYRMIRIRQMERQLGIRGKDE